MEERETRIAFCQRLDIFLLRKTSRLTLEAIHSFIHWVLVAPSSCAKCPVQEYKHSPQLVQRLERF